MECSVCVGAYNKTIRKKVVCPFCHYECCKSCAQAYILSIMDDPHCMNCKQAHDREFVDSFCTRLFRNRELRLHRENVLFDREKSRMPETQPHVNKIIESRRLRAEYRKLGNYITDLIRARTKLEYLGTNDPTIDFIPTREDRLRGPEYRDDPRVADKISEIDHTIEKSRENLSILRTNIQNMAMDGWDDPNASKKFIRKCPTENCKGFLSEDWTCGLCEKQPGCLIPDYTKCIDLTTTVEGITTTTPYLECIENLLKITRKSFEKHKAESAKNENITIISNSY